MARFSGGTGSGSGAPGARGPQGLPGVDGADALWNFVGEYEDAGDYRIGDVVTYLGGTYYRVLPENTGYAPGTEYWTTIAAPGLSGEGGDIADFIFTAEEGQSTISLPGDKQLRIQSGEDSDLYLTAGDDLYIQTLGFGDDIWVQAADDIRFTAGRENTLNEEGNGRSYGWSMNSEGEFHLPENGYISNPYATVITSGNRAATYTDSYLNDQSGIIDQNSVALSVDVDSTWFVDNLYSGIFTSPVVISFADGDSTAAVAIYDATSQGTPAVIFQWNDTIRTKTFAQTYPLTVSVDYTITTYDGTPTIVLDPADNNDDQVLVIDATAPNHIHLRAGGVIDQSTAELFLGGEDTHVKIADQFGSVEILGTDITIRSNAVPSSLNINTYNGARINSARTSVYNDHEKVVATLGDIQAVNTADFVFTTVEAPDYESTMTVTNNDMVLKTVVNTEANGNIKLESAQDISIDAEDISIRSVNNDGDVLAQVRLDRSNSEVRLSASAGNSDYFESAESWSTATWSGNIIVFTDASALDVALAQITGNIAYVSINGGTRVPYSYRSFGDGTLNMGVDASPAVELDPVTVTSIQVYYTNTSYISVDQDDNQEIIISGNQIPVSIDSTESVNIGSSGSTVIIAANQNLALASMNSDVVISADSSIEFTSNDNEAGPQRTWKMTSDGRLELPGNGYIKSIIDGSSDGLENNTIEIVPDFMLWDDGGDQYLVIEPTMAPTPEEPNHIHIRPGGTMDESTTNLILGGERNSVIVSDTYKAVDITTAATITNTYLNASEADNEDLLVPETSDILIGDNIVIAGVSYPVTSFLPDPLNTGFSIVNATGVTFVAGGSYTFVREEPYENSWHFGSDGVLSGPAMGGVKVPGIMNAGVGSDLFIASNDANIQMLATNHVRLDASNGNVYLNPSGGIYLGTSEVAENEIATLGDIDAAVSPVDTAFTVEGGTLGTQPTFNGAPLFTGSYVRAGAMVHFRVDVDFDNILTFGTGQYYINLPFTPKYNYMFTGGCLHDSSTGVTYVITGHVFAGNPQMRLESTDNSGNTSYNIPFTYNHPIVLATADNFHLYGDYIVDTETL